MEYARIRGQSFSSNCARIDDFIRRYRPLRLNTPADSISCARDLTGSRIVPSSRSNSSLRNSRLDTRLSAFPSRPPSFRKINKLTKLLRGELKWNEERKESIRQRIRRIWCNKVYPTTEEISHCIGIVWRRGSVSILLDIEFEKLQPNDFILFFLCVATLPTVSSDVEKSSAALSERKSEFGEFVDFDDSALSSHQLPHEAQKRQRSEDGEARS